MNLSEKLMEQVIVEIDELRKENQRLRELLQVTPSNSSDGVVISKTADFDSSGRCESSIVWVEPAKEKP